MKKFYRSLALILLVAPAMVLSGCVIALGNRGSIEESKGSAQKCCTKAIIMQSPGGKCFKITVDDTGELLSEPVACKCGDGGKCAQGKGCKCGSKGSQGCKCGKGAQGAQGCKGGQAPQRDASTKPAGGCKMQGQMGQMGRPGEPMPMVDMGAPQANK